VAGPISRIMSAAAHGFVRAAAWQGEMEDSVNIRMMISVTMMTGCVLLIGAPTQAHHSFAAEFDENNCREFTGVLTSIDWQNPHAFFYLDVESEVGEVEAWSFQTYALITLKRSGTDRQFFIDNVGNEIWVRGCIAKNGRERYAAAGTLRAADGILRQVGQIQN